MLKPTEGKDHYTLRAADVGRPFIQAFGRSWGVSGFMGQVLPHDVGKRVFLVKYQDFQAEAGVGFLQVENDEQYDARMNRPYNPEDRV